ncbi:unnamed protein product [Parnassius apollo]|uniref:(apollo) hypothetical protein n=1 Tax=Parnassius apollo TaxID=110799 RepID=A0A8S3X4E3_PARAO|nr:unnamed protein product [Parnassius apollo]
MLNYFSSSMLSISATFRYNVLSVQMQESERGDSDIDKLRSDTTYAPNVDLHDPKPYCKGENSDHKELFFSACSKSNDINHHQSNETIVVKGLANVQS